MGWGWKAHGCRYQLGLWAVPLGLCVPTGDTCPQEAKLHGLWEVFKSLLLAHPSDPSVLYMKQGGGILCFLLERCHLAAPCHHPEELSGCSPHGDLELAFPSCVFS